MLLLAESKPEFEARRHERTVIALAAVVGPAVAEFEVVVAVAVAVAVADQNAQDEAEAGV